MFLLLAPSHALVVDTLSVTHSPPSLCSEAKPFLDQNSKQTKVLAEFPPSFVTLSASHGPAESCVLSRISGRSSRCLKEALLRPTLFPDSRQTSGGLQLKGQTPPRQGSWAYILSQKKSNRRGAKEEAAGWGTKSQTGVGGGGAVPRAGFASEALRGRRTWRSGPAKRRAVAVSPGWPID